MADTPVVVTAPATVVAPAPTLSERVTESLAPNTTVQEDLTTHSQRRINLIWESTQALVTVLITCAAIYANIKGINADVLNFAFVAIISTYYARTNHQKVGGIGTEKYMGR